MEEEITLNLDLRCSSEPSDVHNRKTITFAPSSPDYLVGDLTRKIEEVLEIPESSMKLELNSAILQSSNGLDELNLRSEDTIIVYYYSKADCREIRHCTEWLVQLHERLGRWQDSGYASDLDYPRKEECLGILGFDLFLPWLMPQKYANKLYFISKDGLTLVTRLLDIILAVPQSNLPLQLLKIEGQLLVILWNITEDAQIRRAVVAAGGIQSCTKAVLRVPVKPDVQLSGFGGYYFLRQTIRKSLGVFANLCELPEVRLEIASNRDVIEQMLSIPFCPTFDDRDAHSVFMILLVLSYTPETHPHLILQKSFTKLITEYSNSVQMTLVQRLIRYHTSVLFSLLLLVSPQYFNDTLKKLMGNILDNFLSKAISSELSENEEDRSIVWDTMTPHIMALYQLDKQVLVDTHLGSLCKNTLIVTLQTMLHRECHRAVLVKERLVDFVVCLPWYTTGVVQERAMELVSMIRRSPDIQYQPPSLLNISKAAVSMYYCGLDDVMSLSVPELASKLWDMYYDTSSY